MSGASNPVWVTILVGTLGMLGVIGGQVINAWREGRRWRRELDREDLRWQREKEKLSIEQGNETEKNLKDKRIEAYRDLLVCFQNWESKILGLAKEQPESGTPTAEQVAKRIGSCLAPTQDELQRAQAKIDIIGSDSVKKSTDQMRNTLSTIIAKTAGSILASDTSPNIALGIHNLFSPEYDSLLETMRRELDTNLPLHQR